jgi:hypothetical protein
MILMQSEKGGFMNAYNVKEVARLESKGWTVVPERIATKPQAPKARKPRAKK